MIDALRARGTALRVLCVSSAAPVDAPPWLVHLVPGRIQESLARL
jgi:hypothetical protein